MCSFTKKLQLLGDFVPQTSYRGSAPGPRWGPQTPSLLVCPPNNPVRSTPLTLSRHQVRGSAARRAARCGRDQRRQWLSAASVGVLTQSV